MRLAGKKAVLGHLSSLSYGWLAGSRNLHGFHQLCQDHGVNRSVRFYVSRMGRMMVLTRDKIPQINKGEMHQEHDADCARPPLIAWPAPSFPVRHLQAGRARTAPGRTGPVARRLPPAFMPLAALLTSGDLAPVFAIPDGLVGRNRKRRGWIQRGRDRRRPNDPAVVGAHSAPQ